MVPSVEINGVGNLLDAYTTRKSGMRIPVHYAAIADSDLHQDWLQRRKVGTLAAEALQRRGAGRTKPPHAKQRNAPGSLGGTACGCNLEQAGCANQLE